MSDADAEEKVRNQVREIETCHAGGNGPTALERLCS